jgi:uncharacterized protein YjbJ (UPF0337 family)
MKKMTAKKTTVSGKWNEIKQDIKKAWTHLSENEIEKTKGDIKELQQLIQKKYGDVKEDYNEKLSHIFSRFEKEPQVAAVKPKTRK